MAAQWPLVVQQLLTVLPTLTGWSQVQVIDGPIIGTTTPDLFVTVGSDGGDPASGGSYTTSQAPDGVRYAETGEVRCQLTAQSGEEKLPAVRAQVFALADAVEAWLRSDRTLGVLAPDSTCDFVADPVPVQNQAGAAFTIVFTVSYLTIT